jgi:cytidylate kinase
VAVITISRQYGSGGNEIAGRVAEMLGYRIFNKRMIARMASEVGLSDDEIVDFSPEDHKVHSLLERLFGGRRSPAVAQIRTWTEDTRGVQTEQTRELDEDEATALIRYALETAYERGNVVIVGRGGQAILMEMSGVLHVRIEAPLDARVEHLQDREGISVAAAQEMGTKRDKAAADYLKRFHGIDWSDPLLYHLVINTGKWDIEAAAHLIVNAVGHLAPDAPPGENPRAQTEPIDKSA